jgi:hypothetical protein
MEGHTGYMTCDGLLASFEHLSPPNLQLAPYHTMQVINHRLASFSDAQRKSPLNVSPKW